MLTFFSNNIKSISPHLTISSSDVHPLIDAYIDIRNFSKAYIYSTEDERYAEFYKANIPYLVGYSDQLTLADGSAIPLKDGDFLIPIVIKDKKIANLMGMAPMDSAPIFLPFFFLTQHQFSGCISLKYSNQLFDINLKDFDPDFKNTENGKISNKDLVKAMEHILYFVNGGMAPCHNRFFLNEGKNSRKKYRAPSKILKQSETLKKICQLHQENILKVIPIEVKKSFSIFEDDYQEKPSLALKFDSDQSFDLGIKVQELADKKIKILSFGKDSMYKPRISKSSLHLYCEHRNLKNTVLSISENSLVLLQEHESEKKIKNNEKIRITHYIGSDGTLTYVPFSLFKERGLNAQKVLDGLNKASYKNGYLRIPFV